MTEYENVQSVVKVLDSFGLVDADVGSYTLEEVAREIVQVLGMSHKSRIKAERKTLRGIKVRPCGVCPTPSTGTQDEWWECPVCHRSWIFWDGFGWEQPPGMAASSA